MRGFKSFPDEVEVRLEPGVAVVVGPNGSGKSNIADAVVWAAGSLSPSELRAGLLDAEQPLDPGASGVTLAFPSGDLALERAFFDLSGAGLRLTPEGTGWSVARVDAAPLPDVGTPLDLGDDDSRSMVLPFAFPFYGREYSLVFINSDGNLTFGQADTETTARMATGSADKLAQGGSQVLAWCPSCYVQFSETTLPTVEKARGSRPFEMTPLMVYLGGRLDDRCGPGRDPSRWRDRGMFDPGLHREFGPTCADRRTGMRPRPLGKQCKNDQDPSS